MRTVMWLTLMRLLKIRLMTTALRIRWWRPAKRRRLPPTLAWRWNTVGYLWVQKSKSLKDMFRRESILELHKWLMSVAYFLWRKTTAPTTWAPGKEDLFSRQCSFWIRDRGCSREATTHHITKSNKTENRLCLKMGSNSWGLRSWNTERQKKV